MSAIDINPMEPNAQTPDHPRDPVPHPGKSSPRRNDLPPNPVNYWTLKRSPKPIQTAAGTNSERSRTVSNRRPLTRHGLAIALANWTELRFTPSLRRA